HYFLVIFGHEGQKPLDLRSEDESDCNEWVECIQQARYSQTNISFMVFFLLISG
ncbi:Ras-specific guanine nucleotide-releasing factor 2, partial [Xenotaenia resolanae]